jgi:hypothetical protein
VVARAIGRVRIQVSLSCVTTAASAPAKKEAWNATKMEVRGRSLDAISERPKTRASHGPSWAQSRKREPRAGE